MTGRKSRDEFRANRRAVVVGIVTTASVTLGGCSSIRGGSGTGRKDAEPDSNADAHPPEEFVNAKSETRSVYERINSVPVVTDDEFVFDVNAFEDDFDHEAVLSDARELQERINAMDAADVPDAELDGLQVTLELAESLVRQRLFLHQVIVGGLTFEDLFAEAEFGAAIETIRDARGFLDSLVTSGERVEELLDRQKGRAVSVDGYDPAAIRETQEVLVEMTRWSNPAYEGLHHSAAGFDSFVAANEAMEMEQFGKAKRAFRNARAHYQAAGKAFDRSRGRGRSIDYLAPTVEGISCVVPAYLEGCERLGDALEELDVGNEERGFELAEETLREMDRKVARCMSPGGVQAG